MHTIAVAGHLCLDIAPRLGATAELTPGSLIEVGPLAITLGGSVANTGGTLAELGAHVTPFAGIGDDELGSLLVAKLREEGIDAATLTPVAGATTSYSLVIEKPGIDRTFWHHTGANSSFDGTSVEPGDAGILHVGYPPLLPALITRQGEPLRALLARARAAGAATSVDLAVVDPDSVAGAADWDAILTRMAAETDLFSPSLDDLTSALRIDEPFSLELVESLAARFLAAGVAIVAISAGRDGLFIRTAPRERFLASGAVLAAVADTWSSRSVDVLPLWVETPVTTNGAGDAASAGLVFALASATSLEEAGALAAACSAALISGSRATPAAIAALSPQLAPLFAGIVA